MDHKTNSLRQPTDNEKIERLANLLKYHTKSIATGAWLTAKLELHQNLTRHRASSPQITATTSAAMLTGGHNSTTTVFQRQSSQRNLSSVSYLNQSNFSANGLFD